MPNYNTYSLDELFIRVKKSDQVAFNEIYERTWEKLYIKAMCKLNDEDLAKDLVQDLYIDLWEKRFLKEIGNLSAYLNNALRFKVIDIYRKKNLSRENLDKIEIILIESNSSDINCLENDLQQILKTWIQHLPAKRKEIFEFYYYHYKTTKEISEILNISIKTVQNQLLLSKVSLKSTFKKLFFLILFFLFGI